MKQNTHSIPEDLLPLGCPITAVVIVLVVTKVFVIPTCFIQITRLQSPIHPSTSLLLHLLHAVVRLMLLPRYFSHDSSFRLSFDRS
jgi:hypothetical protein